MAPKAVTLSGIEFKLVRAKKHLDEVLRLTQSYGHGHCEITLEPKFEHGYAVFRIRLSPKISPEISATVGDFLFNVRSALDHIVWQLVFANPPCEPKPSNQFPICASPEEFADAVARKRLRGVPEKASTLIETLQPYMAGENPLGLLNRLHNIDKHRTLNVVTVVADNAELLSSNGAFALSLGNDELRDGAQWGDLGISLEAPGVLNKIQSGKTVQMNGKCSLFVAFDDPAAESLESFRVDRTLAEIFEFVRDTVVPAFEPFFN